MRKKEEVNVSSNRTLGDREHLLARPEMVIKDCVSAEVAGLYVMGRDSRVAQVEKARINPGVVHLFVECYSNAADNAVKNGHVERLAADLKGKRAAGACERSDARVHVELTPEYMLVQNYGAPFNISVVGEAGGAPVFEPELCFTRPRTGSNFDDDTEKGVIGVGRNGYGAKLITYYSKAFRLVCVDAKRRRYFEFTCKDNAHPDSYVRRWWPPLSDGAMVNGTGIAAPAEFEAAFSEGSSTSVYWVPDTENGDLQPEEIGGFVRGLPEGALLVVRRVVSGETKESKVRVKRGGTALVSNAFGGSGETVDICKLGGVRHIKAPEAGTSLPATACIFRGSSGISDEDIDACARTVRDFSVCGIPARLRRRWSDGAAAETFVYPTGIMEYGRELFGPECKTAQLSWSAKGVQLSCEAVYFDTPGAGQALGFVNGLHTTGGMHIRAAYDSLKDSIKDDADIKRYAPNMTVADLRRNFSCVVSCRGSNPKQEGQTKENLTMISGQKSFSMGRLPLEVVSKICTGQGRWLGAAALMAGALHAEQEELRRSVQKKKVTGYIPANVQGPDSVLMAMEGDSCIAYMTAIKNLNVKSDMVGGFSLRGKPPNLYEADLLQVYSSRVLSSIIKITGLDPEKDYRDPANLATLRYGFIVFLGDPDLDGFHIIALMIANIAKFWPFMLEGRRVGFLRTPVVRIFGAGGKVLARYYSDAEYTRDSDAGVAPKGEPKRIKGLGSVETGKMDKPAPEVIDDFEHASLVVVAVTADCAGAMDDFFSKKKAWARKHHITRLAAECYEVDEPVVAEYSMIPPVTKATVVQRTFVSYVSKEVIQYSIGSLLRAIPSKKDGMKDAIRKIVAYFCEEMFAGRGGHRLKVDQVAGKISEKQHYHHGGASMGAAIKRLALGGFPGANNLPILLAESNCGSKWDFPDDCAQDRYAFVKIAPWLKYAVHKHIYEAVKRKISEGEEIEPEHLPCDIPIVLANGNVGVATGWRTYIPPCHPGSLVDWLIERAAADTEGRAPAPREIPFWYEGFKGTITLKETVVARPPRRTECLCPEGECSCEQEDPPEQQISKRAIVARGCYEFHKLPDGTQSLRITEVPPETRLLELLGAIQDLQEEGLVQSFHHDTKNGIDFRIKFTHEGTGLGQTAMVERLGLVDAYSLDEFNFLDESGAPRNVGSAEEYIEMFYAQTIQDYEAGKMAQIKALEEKRDVASHKLAYIEAVVGGRIVPGKTTEAELAAALEHLGVPERYATAHARDFSTEGVLRVRDAVSRAEEEIAKVRAHRACEQYLANLRIIKEKVKFSDPPVREGNTWHA